MLQKQHGHSPCAITLWVIHMCVSTRLRMITPQACGSPAWDDTGSSSSLWADRVRLHMRAPCVGFCGLGKSKSIPWECYSCVPPKGLHHRMNCSMGTWKSLPSLTLRMVTLKRLFASIKNTSPSLLQCRYKSPVCGCVIASPYSCVKGFKSGWGVWG